MTTSYRVRSFRANPLFGPRDRRVVVRIVCEGGVDSHTWLAFDYRHSRRYHPQTCGKVERFHQTMKAFVAKQDPAETIAVLQADVDRFVDYYNEVRPHRACGRRPPITAFEARDKARPSGPKIVVGAGVRVRKDRIDKHGRLTLRHRSKLHHIGIGARHRGRP